MFSEQSVAIVELVERKEAGFCKDRFSMTNPKETFKLVNSNLKGPYHVE